MDSVQDLKKGQISMTNSKMIGTAFEQEMCGILKRNGYWVHFMSPDNRGAQPFDIIAVKDGQAYAVDCKTCKEKYLYFTRLEDNQILAFNHWMSCGNGMPYLAVKHEGMIYMIPYLELRQKGKIELSENYLLEAM